MKKTMITFCLSIFTFMAMAQFVGTTTITFNDPARRGGFGFGGGPGRQIQTEIYYPATSNGANRAVASGNFPVVVFGHGFVMRWDAYAFLYNRMAQLGYIVVLPRTEGEVLPNHEDFAKDLAIVAARMQGENTRTGSRFLGKVASATAVGGHSMGGKATVLSDKYQTTPVTCYFNFAPANGVGNGNMFTDAANVTEPFLVMGGAFDKVAPSATEAKPLYNALGSACKTYLNIRGGYHCQFNDYNFNFATGETLLFPSLGGLNRSQQQNVVLNYLVPYLDFYLKGNTAQGIVFTNRVSAATEMTERLRSCGNNKTGDFNEEPLTELVEPYWYVYPNPVQNQMVVQINAESNTNAIVEVYGIQGNLVAKENLDLTTGANQWFCNTAEWTKGLYNVRITSNERVENKQILKQ
jgi:predicted dienelactone hydrolase